MTTRRSALIQTDNFSFPLACAPLSFSTDGVAVAKISRYFFLFNNISPSFLFKKISVESTLDWFLFSSPASLLLFIYACYSAYCHWMDWITLTSRKNRRQSFFLRRGMWSAWLMSGGISWESVRVGASETEAHHFFFCLTPWNEGGTLGRRKKLKAFSEIFILLL